MIPGIKSEGLLPVLKFLVKLLALYILWHLLYEIWLHPYGKMDDWLSNNTASLSAILLDLFGQDITVNSRMLSNEAGAIIYIGDPCNGFKLFALFSIFIIAWPTSKLPLNKGGRGIINKIIFIALGVLSIHLLNIFRVAGLSLIQIYAPSTLAFNHTYTFTMIVYGYIFLLWMLWVGTVQSLKFKVQS